MKKEKPIWLQYSKTAIIAMIVAIALRLFVVGSYRICSGSMEGSLLTGDCLFVNKLAYHATTPERGDIIVFVYPMDSSMDFIKRIIGLPGDTLSVVNKVVFCNGNVLPDPPTAQHVDSRTFPAEQSERDNFGPVVVPPNTYFVMGDNRDDSRDSRFWGCVPQANIKGKAVAIYWSWNAKYPWYNPMGFRPARMIVAAK